MTDEEKKKRIAEMDQNIVLMLAAAIAGVAPPFEQWQKVTMPDGGVFRKMPDDVPRGVMCVLIAAIDTLGNVLGMSRHDVLDAMTPAMELLDGVRRPKLQQIWASALVHAGNAMANAHNMKLSLDSAMAEAVKSRGEVN